MKKIIYTTLAFAVNLLLVHSQVKDISFTFSPVVNHTFWDSKAGLEDGFLYGGKLGFGFGEFLELRALYMQSSDLKTNFEDYGINGYNPALFNSQEILLTRWGGEFKANISNSRLAPYITLGTGVQNIEIKNGADFDQIFTSIGLGIKTKLNDRILLNIEGKNTLFNFNSGENLLTQEDKDDFGVTNADFDSNLLQNWSIQASLQFYLGGRRPGTLSALDKAYLNKFKQGFKGIQWIVEPGAAFIEFDKESNFRDSYFIGGYAGIDFNKFIGVRGFYFHATNNEKLSTDFDKLAMYGFELRARLNDGNGVTPFLVLGGGFINPDLDYTTKDGTFLEHGEEFAMAGLGLNIPLSRNILISGGVRGLVTSSENIEDLSRPDNLQTHIMYNAGIKLTFGKKTQDPEVIYNQKLSEKIAERENELDKMYAEQLESQTEESKMRLQRLEEKYQTQLDSLQTELKIAQETKDTKKAVEILEKKEKTEKSLEEVKTVSKDVSPASKKTQSESSTKQTQQTTTQSEATQKQKSPKELVKMTPQELELLIDKILDKTYPLDTITKPQKSKSSDLERIERRLDQLEKRMMDNSNLNKNDVVKTITETKVLKPVNDSAKVAIDTVVVEEIRTGRFIKEVKTSGISNAMDYLGASTYIGFNLGDQSAPLLGLRMNYEFKQTKVDFMPEIYYGFDNPNLLGASANFIYKFNEIASKENLTPYLGIGGGVSKIDDSTGFHHNIILGTNVNVFNGRLFVDFTSRNFSENNQIALGYRFNF